MTSLRDIAQFVIEDASEELYALSDEIWSHPELTGEEYYCHELLTNWFMKKGCSVDKAYKGVKTAFRACFGPKTASPHVVIFCEYDALPEIGHGCGHNLVAEVCAAAALGVKAAMEAADNNLGRLTVLGIPGGERGGGKVELVNRGALEGVDVAMICHPSGRNILQQTTLAMVESVITFHGKAPRVPLSTREGDRVLDAAVLALQYLSCLRQQLKPDYKVHGMIKNGGSNPDVILEETSMTCSLQAPTAADLLELVNKCGACIEEAALTTECTVNIEYEHTPCLEMVHNPTLTDLYVNNCTRLGIKLDDHKTNLSGSTGMGNVSYVVPSIHPHFGIGQGLINHSRDFTNAAGSPSNQARTIAEGKILAGVTLDVMQCQDVMRAIKSEFQQSMRENNIEAVRELLEKCSSSMPR